MPSLKDRLLKTPNPEEVKKAIEDAINNGVSPSKLFYDFLEKEGLASKFIKDLIEENKEAIQVLVSEKGRLYIYTTLNNLLDYLDTLTKPEETDETIEEK